MVSYGKGKGDWGLPNCPECVCGWKSETWKFKAAFQFLELRIIFKILSLSLHCLYYKVLIST